MTTSQKSKKVYVVLFDGGRNGPSLIEAIFTKKKDAEDNLKKLNDTRLARMKRTYGEEAEFSILERELNKSSGMF